MDEARVAVGANGPAAPQRNGARFQRRVDLLAIRIIGEALIVPCARFSAPPRRVRDYVSPALDFLRTAAAARPIEISAISLAIIQCNTNVCGRL